jgi:hypothetical protein
MVKGVFKMMDKDTYRRKVDIVRRYNEVLENLSDTLDADLYDGVLGDMLTAYVDTIVEDLHPKDEEKFYNDFYDCLFNNVIGDLEDLYGER